jgi:hypothetical protein
MYGPGGSGKPPVAAETFRGVVDSANINEVSRRRDTARKNTTKISLTLPTIYTPLVLYWESHKIQHI